MIKKKSESKMGKIVKLKPVKVCKNREHDDQTEHPRPPRALLTHHSSQPHTKTCMSPAV